MSIIDITKTYATRDGREAVIFEVSDRVYCKIKDEGEWCVAWRQLNGHAFGVSKSAGDLIPAKTWRAWREGEAPSVFMARNKKTKTTTIGYRQDSALCLRTYFEFYAHLHEDGTETPCGVCE